jgi:RhtB (resistance to homoserine/threonine) family protein
MTEFITITFIGLLMIISPGPDFAIVTKTSIIQGRLAGLFAAIGISSANLVHVAINLLGIGLIISKSIMAFTIMKFLGAGYLLYIGYKGLRAKPLVISEETKKSVAAESSLNLGRKGFLSGFYTSLLNPKACLFFLSFFSVIVSADTPRSTQIFYGIWLSSIACAWFMLVAVFFTHPYISEKLKQSKHWIERVTGGALVLLGLRLLGTEAAL